MTTPSFFLDICDGHSHECFELRAWPTRGKPPRLAFQSLLQSLDFILQAGQPPRDCKLIGAKDGPHGEVDLFSQRNGRFAAKALRVVLAQAVRKASVRADRRIEKHH